MTRGSVVHKDLPALSLEAESLLDYSITQSLVLKTLS